MLKNFWDDEFWTLLVKPGYYNSLVAKCNNDKNSKSFLGKNTNIQTQ